ncbi:MAG TPA: serine/threonine-protein kinase [Pyrinomonadaceae bacterium]|jgi:serine/threonine protein kinase
MAGNENFSPEVAASDYEKIKEIFSAAVELAPARRAAFLDANCTDAQLRREVESLLEARDEADDFLNDLSAVRVVQDSYERGNRFIGQKIDKYRIEREIGRGGMGVVFLAAREDFRQQVALKIIKRGMDSEAIVERFAREREILAALNHPYIARLLDGGTTPDGLPFFVMEYVEGMAVDEYCRKKAVSETARLELFRKICAAVQFAHQKLIVHRDLKPSNILVTDDGTPKLLDFGIAKLLNASDAQETQTNQRVLTPAYASPEQLRGEIVGTTSDVYSLGLILSEMLEVPSHKFRVAGSSSGRPNLNPETNRQKTKTQNLNSDLSNILAMSLRADAMRRYGSSEAFSEDIRRYLEGLPVSARRDSSFYRASKFVRRNAAAVSVSGLLILSLIGGLAATVWQWRIAQRERAVAEERFNTLQKSSRSMITEINGALMDLPSTLPARRLLLERAMEQLDALAAGAENNPQVQVDLGDAYQNINYLPDKTLDERVALLHKSMSFYEKVVASDARSIPARKGLAMDNVNLADIARMQGDIPTAAEHNRQAVDLLEAVIRDEPESVENQTDLWNVYYNAALTFNLQGRAAESLEICRRMTPLADKLKAENPVDLSGNEFRRPYLSRALAGGNLIYLGRYDEALPEIDFAIEANRQQRAAHPDSLYARLDEAVFKGRLANALEKKGAGEEALKVMRESLALNEKLAAENAKDNYYLGTAARSRTVFGQLLARTGKFAEAVSYFQNAIRMEEEILAKDAAQRQSKFDLAAALGGLGNAFFQTGKRDEGLAKQRQSLAIYAELSVAGSGDSVLRRDFAEVAAETAENLLLANEADAARALFQQSYDVLKPMQEQQTLSAFDAALLEKVADHLKS